MAEMKLGKLPDRTPVKHTITVQPVLHKRLLEYAAMYNETHNQGDPEELEALIPYMLEAFLGSDRAFARRLKEQKRETQTLGAAPTAGQTRRRQSAAGAYTAS